MIPYNCDLGDEIPREIRLEVYKKALEIVKEDKIVYGLETSLYLCLLLPCILFDLTLYLEYQPNGKIWYYENTKKSFPEINYKAIEKLKISSVIKIKRILELENAIKILR